MDPGLDKARKSLNVALRRVWTLALGELAFSNKYVRVVVKQGGALQPDHLRGNKYTRLMEGEGVGLSNTSGTTNVQHVHCTMVHGPMVHGKNAHRLKVNLWNMLKTCGQTMQA